MMSNSKPITNLESSLYPSNADRRSVGMMGSDVAPSVLAVCRIEGAQSDLHYYNTTFSGGAGSGGSLGCVTGNPTSRATGIAVPQRSPIPASPSSTSFPRPIPNSHSHHASKYPLTPDSSPDLSHNIPSPHGHHSKFTGQLQTPPQTPEDGPSSNDPNTLTALEVLATLFPNSEAARAALPYARALRIISRQGATPDASTWDGVVLSLPGQERTLYVIGRGAEALMLRESVTALLDLADEYLQCTAFVIALEKNTPGLGDLVHALTYLSGQIVKKPPFVANPAYVLVGIEL
ncbi:Ornithine decarboxylase antizyme, partial [Rhizoctonia solani]